MSDQVLRQDIEEEKSKFIKDIREYVRSQCTLWRRVPWLALFADDGLGGLRGNDLSFAYYSGLWRVRESSVHPSKTIAIDCATGELIYADGPRALASDIAVFRIAGNLDLIDAEFVIRRLEWEARRPYPSSPPTGYDSVEEWRQKILRQTQLTQIYVRHELP